MRLTQLHLLYYMVPLLLLVLAIRRTRRRRYLAHSRLAGWSSSFSPAGRSVHLPLLLRWGAFLCLAVAVLDPELSFAEQEIQFRGVDIVLVTDLSSSMQQALPVDAVEGARYPGREAFFAPLGVNPSRLDAVKLAVKTFIGQRRNDRIGLVVFSSNAYVVSPMTLDYDYLTGYVDMMDRRTLVGEGMTAIGEGIAAGTELILKQNQATGERRGDKLLIVLTDGENNYGRTPVEAVEHAGRQGFKIYLIGVNVPASPPTSRLIEAITSSGGIYYDVRNQEQLNDAYWEIGALEKGAFVVTRYDRSVPFYHRAVLASVLCLGLALGLPGLSYFSDLA